MKTMREKNEKETKNYESQSSCKIIELINQYNIETQEELADRLNNAGFKVTQATISRDIRDLKLTKVASGRRQTEICRAARPDEGAE